MDRPIVYTQEQVRNYDHMENGWSSMVIGNSNLFADLTGASVTSIAGFAPTYNSNLTVTLAAGRIYALAPVDAAAYGGWPANTANIYQQGQNPIQTLTFSLAGLSSGQSRWALVEVAYNQADIIPANDPTAGVLTYYNPANPSQPLVGPNNAGTPQPTLRQAQAVLTIKYGAVATTGSEIPPTVDSGNVPMYLVDLTFGQTSITSANLFIAGPAVTPNPPSYTAPFITVITATGNNAFTGNNLYTGGLVAYAAAGTNTYTVSGTFPTLIAGQTYEVNFANANTNASTLQLGSNSAISIVQKSTNRATLTGELTTNYGYQLYYNGTNFVILNPKLHFDGVFAYQVTPQTITNNSITAVLLDTEVYKTISGFHSTSANTSRLVAGQTGVNFVRVVGQVCFPSTSSVGSRAIYIYKNGVAMTPPLLSLIAAQLVANQDIIQIVGPVLPVSPGDYFEIMCFQNSGGNLTLIANQSWGSLEVVG